MIIEVYSHPNEDPVGVIEYPGLGFPVDTQRLIDLVGQGLALAQRRVSKNDYFFLDRVKGKLDIYRFGKKNNRPLLTLKEKDN